MISCVRRVVLAWLLCGLCAAEMSAQDDVIARARAEAGAGRRTEGIALLKSHLEVTPGDVDARLVYGLILSWDQQYDEARLALNAVLAQAPDYLDARVALMNVEWWSGRTEVAREIVHAILAKDPGNTQARLVKQRLDARHRPWSVEVMMTRDAFDDDREPWTETGLSLGRETPVGPIFVRGRQAQRFGLEDQQADIEFYPTFRAGTYAFVGVGFGKDELLYPEHYFYFDLYQSIGRGFEVSGGYRNLGFAETTRIYLGTLTKYSGNWMLTGKALVVPDPLAGESWSYHFNVRRYFGGAGTSYYGFGYGHGFSREEPRDAGDLTRVDADTVRSMAEVEVRDRFVLSFGASASRQERAFATPLWQYTAGAGVKVMF
jgi:YaiO family outer membrane protein